MHFFCPYQTDTSVPCTQKSLHSRSVHIRKTKPLTSTPLRHWFENNPHSSLYANHCTQERPSQIPRRAYFNRRASIPQASCSSSSSGTGLPWLFSAARPPLDSQAGIVCTHDMCCDYRLTSQHKRKTLINTVSQL